MTFIYAYLKYIYEVSVVCLESAEIQFSSSKLELFYLNFKIGYKMFGKQIVSIRHGLIYLYFTDMLSIHFYCAHIFRENT